MLRIQVTICYPNGEIIRRYSMDHDNLTERRVLGEQCRNAFEAGQMVSTIPFRMDIEHAPSVRHSA